MMKSEKRSSENVHRDVLKSRQDVMSWGSRAIQEVDKLKKQQEETNNRLDNRMMQALEGNRP